MKFKAIAILLFVPLLFSELRWIGLQSTWAQGRVVATIIEGTVLVKRSGSSSYDRFPSGSPLYVGDLVKVESGEAVVRCSANGVTRTLPDDGIPQGIVDICP